MRAPGNVSARPGLAGLRAPSATSSPVRDCATPPAKDLAMLPGPRMPQRIFADVMSNSPWIAAIPGMPAKKTCGSADPCARLVEEQRTFRLDRDREMVAAGALARGLALDDQLLGPGIGVDITHRAEMLGDVGL